MLLSCYLDTLEWYWGTTSLFLTNPIKLREKDREVKIFCQNNLQIDSVGCFWGWHRQRNTPLEVSLYTEIKRWINNKCWMCVIYQLNLILKTIWCWQTHWDSFTKDYKVLADDFNEPHGKKVEMWWHCPCGFRVQGRGSLEVRNDRKRQQWRRWKISISLEEKGVILHLRMVMKETP